MRRLLTCVAVITFIGVPVSVAQSHPRATAHRCKASGHLLLADRQAEVYEAEEPAVRGGLSVNACLFHSGRTTRLGGPKQCGSGVCSGVEQATLNHAIVAYESFFTGDEEGRWYVVVRDLRSGRVLRRVPTGTPAQARSGFVGVGRTSSIVVGGDGGVAWIAEDLQRTTPETPSTSEALYFDVYVADEAGVRLLGAGTDVASSSLALGGSTAYWTQSGKALSAAL